MVKDANITTKPKKSKIQKSKSKNQKPKKIEKIFIFFCKITLLISLQLSKNSYGDNQSLVEK